MTRVQRDPSASYTPKDTETLVKLYPDQAIYPSSPAFTRTALPPISNSSEPFSWSSSNPRPQTFSHPASRLATPAPTHDAPRFSVEFLSRYVPLNHIGSGGFGVVFTAEDAHCISTQLPMTTSQSRIVAVKLMYRSRLQHWTYDPLIGTTVPLEVSILHRTRHKSIIGLEDYYEDSRFIYMVQEFFGHQWEKTLYPSYILDPRDSPPQQYDLFAFIENQSSISESLARNVFVQIVNAVAYLHDGGIYHRDLKEDNILIDEHFQIKLIDFGCAFTLSSLSSTDSPWGATSPKPPASTFVHYRGTRHYASPEQRSGYWTVSNLAPSEVWTLGTLLYTMVTKESPFRSQGDLMNGRVTIRDSLDPGVGPIYGSNAYKAELKVDSGWLDVVQACLQADVDRRMTIPELLLHPWMTGS